MKTTSPDRNRRLIELRSELRQATEEMERLEDACMKILNQPVPYTAAMILEYKQLVQEEKDILKLFNRESGDIVQLYRSYMEKAGKIEKKKVQQINDLKAKLALLRDDDTVTDFSRRPTIGQTFRSFKEQFDQLKRIHMSFTSEIVSQLQDAKLQIRSIITNRGKEAKAKLEQLNEEIKSAESQRDTLLNEKQQRLERLTFQSDVNTFSWQQDPAEIVEAITKTAEIAIAFRNRFLDYNFDFEPLNSKLDAMDSKVTKLKEKVVLIKKIRTEKREKNIANNYAVMARYLLKTHYRMAALDEIIEETEKERDDVMIKLEKERKEANQLVGNSGMTVQQIRLEIVRLTKEIGTEQMRLTAELKETEEEHKRVETSYMSQIEKLEAQEKLKRSPARPHRSPTKDYSSK